MDTARARSLALFFALGLVAVSVWAVAIEANRATCPHTGAFSCVAIVRPALRTLGPIPILSVFVLGSFTESFAVLLLRVRGAKLPFARDVALLAAAGAGFAVGLQPLSLLVVKRACLVCTLAAGTQLLAAFTLAQVASRLGASRRGPFSVFLATLVVTGGAATFQGILRAREDERRHEALRRLPHEHARVVLLEREGCPYCEALELDLLAEPVFLARLEKTGFDPREAPPGTPAPILLALDASGKEVARVEGFMESREAYASLLDAASH